MKDWIYTLRTLAFIGVIGFGIYGGILLWQQHHPKPAADQTSQTSSDDSGSGAGIPLNDPNNSLMQGSTQSSGLQGLSGTSSPVQPAGSAANSSGNPQSGEALGNIQQ